MKKVLILLTVMLLAGSLHAQVNKRTGFLLDTLTTVELNALDAKFKISGSLFWDRTQDGLVTYKDGAWVLLGSGLSPTDIDTLAELNAILTDANLSDGSHTVDTDDQTIAEVLASGNDANGLNITALRDIYPDRIILGMKYDAPPENDADYFMFQVNSDSTLMLGFKGLTADNYRFNFDGSVVSDRDVATKLYVDTNGGGGTDDQTASEVPFTPAGGLDLSSANVEDALNELDLEKMNNVVANNGDLRVFSTSSSFSTISGDLIDNQTATEVPFTPYSTIAATNTQTAIQELLDEATGGTSLTKATQIQAEAGTDDTTYMTPLKTAQAITALVPVGTLTSEQSERIANTSKKKVISVTSNTTLANVNFEPLTPDMAKEVFHISGGDFTVTIPTGLTSETPTDFKISNIDHILTFEAEAGVTLYGRDIENGVLTNGFTLDSLERVTLTPLGSDVFSVDGYVKKLDVVYGNPELYTTLNRISRVPYETDSDTGYNQSGVTVTNEATIIGEGVRSARITNSDNVSDRIDIFTSLPTSTTYVVKYFKNNATSAVSIYNWAGFSTIGTETATGITNGTMTEYTRTVTTNATSQTIRVYIDGGVGYGIFGGLSIKLL